MTRKALKRFTGIIQENSISGLWFKLLGRTIYRRLILIKRDLHAPVNNVCPGIPITITLLRHDEIDDYIRFRPDADYTTIQHRLDKNAWCFVARHENRIVHSIWAFAKSAWIDYLKCCIQLSDNEIILLDSFTLPEFRGLNIAPARGVFLMQYFKNLGYCRLLGVVHKDNKPAFGPAEKTGWIPCGMKACIMIGPWRYHF